MYSGFSRNAKPISCICVCVCVCVCVRACVCVCCAVLSHSVVCNSLWLHRLQPGSSVHGDSPGKNTGVGCHTLLQRIFPTQGLNLGLPHFRQFLYHLSHQGSPRILEWVTYPFSRGSSRPRNQTRVSRIAEGFFTSWATREARVCVCVYRDLLLGVDSHNYGCFQVSASTVDWIFRRADDIYSSSPKTSGIETQEEMMFHFKSKSRKIPVSWVRGSQQEKFSFTWNKLSLLFHLALQLIGWGSPALRRTIFFTQSIDVNVRLIQNTLAETLWIVFDQIFGHPMVKLRWHINLIIYVIKFMLPTASMNCVPLFRWLLQNYLSHEIR